MAQVKALGKLVRGRTVEVNRMSLNVDDASDKESEVEE